MTRILRDEATGERFRVLHVGALPLDSESVVLRPITDTPSETEGQEPTMSPDRILWNSREVNDIDEIVLSGVDVHIEQMDDRCWWIGLYRGHKPDSPYWMGNFRADSRGRMTFYEQENAGIEWTRDECHEDGGCERCGDTQVVFCQGCSQRPHVADFDHTVPCPDCVQASS